MKQVTKYVRLEKTVARKAPGLGWEIVQPGNLNDFNRLIDLLLEVEAKGAALDEAAQRYGAVVHEE